MQRCAFEEHEKSRLIALEMEKIKSHLACSASAATAAAQTAAVASSAAATAAASAQAAVVAADAVSSIVIAAPQNPNYDMYRRRPSHNPPDFAAMFAEAAAESAAADGVAVAAEYREMAAAAAFSR